MEETKEMRPTSSFLGEQRNTVKLMARYGKLNVAIGGPGPGHYSTPSKGLNIPTTNVLAFQAEASAVQVEAEE